MDNIAAMIETPSTISILLGLFFGVLVSLVAYLGKALSRSGALAAAILGTVVFGLGGIPAAVVLLTFFISSSILSVLFRKHKYGLNGKHAKGSRRDAGQVLANGGISGIMIILWVLFPNQEWLWWAFCASLAAANADTWATEMGILSPSRPRLITTGDRVEMGTSGGITPVGTLASLAGALVVALVGFFLREMPVHVLLLITLAGMAGSLVDSYLGATIQAVYFCPKCEKETERHPTHVCGTETRRLRGMAWLDNDWVNGFCTLTPVILVGIFSLLK
jgi:uncharacterized protein (TIGR00297 family)